MGNDILHEVIAVETEIQRNIEIEKKKTNEWIEKVKRDAEDEIGLEEERIKESVAQALSDAKADAERKAAEIIEKAVARAEILKGFDSESLREIIMKRIVRILPGGTL
jgi:vacuolar-type H+-ATPase subunit H